MFGPSNVAPWPPHLTEPSREPKSWSGSAYPHPKEHHTMVNWRTVILCYPDQVTTQRTSLLHYCVLSHGKPLRFNARNYMKQNCNVPKSPVVTSNIELGASDFFCALSLLLSHFMDIIEECVKSGTESIFSINRG